MKKIYNSVGLSFWLMLFAIGLTNAYAQCTIEVTMESDGYGDEVTWQLLDGSNAVVLSGGPYPDSGGGYSETQSTTFMNPPYTLVIDRSGGSFCDNEPTYTVTMGGSLDITGTLEGDCNIETFALALECPPPTPPTPTQAPGMPTCLAGTTLDVAGTPGTDVEWYWQTSATGTSFSDPTGTPYAVFFNGTYYLRAYSTITGFWSTLSSSVVVSNIPLATTPPTPIASANPACYTTGSELTMPAAPAGLQYFWQGTNPTGVSNAMPATVAYTVPGSGTYYVAAFETASGCWSVTNDLAVTLGTFIPSAPIADPDHVYGCKDLAPSLMLNAIPQAFNTEVIELTGTYVLTPLTTTTLDFPINLPAGAVVLSASLVFNNVSTYGFTYPVDIEISMSGAASLPTDVLAYVWDEVTNDGPYYSFPTINGNGIATLEMTHLYEFGGDAEIGSVALMIDYELTTATIAWFDEAAGGDLQGMDSPFNAVGTTVMPNDDVSGDYEFYAFTNADGCYSDEGVLVTASLAPVNIELLPVDVSCNNGNDGSFTVGTEECGSAPYEFSVDGGAFGPAPTDLTIGDHTVVVKDNFGQLSALYNIAIHDAPAPSDIVVNDYTNTMIDISWTQNGLESQWNVEWGMPGFIPGTGDEIGSAVASGTPDYIISGLDGFTTYDIYVSANCGVGTTTGYWIMISQMTSCDAMTAQGFCESFDSDSPTQDCWVINDENEDFYAWYLDDSEQPNTGDESASIYTDGNGGDNDDWLIMPLMTLTNNEIMNFYYSVNSMWEPNEFEVLLSTTGKSPADFTEVLLAPAEYYNENYENATIDLTAYSGDCYIAFHVPNGGPDGWVLFIDDVCVDICIPDEGTDGTEDVCSLDGTLDLSSVIVPGEPNGVWEFTPNQGVISGSDLNLNLLPAGTYTMEYIVKTACTSDTTLATITVHPPSSAGIDGTLDDVCTNWNAINVQDALSGIIELGGTWTNNSGEGTLDGSVWTPAETTTAGTYTFGYAVSNGVCPEQTATATINLISCLGIDNIENSFLSVYPNPVSDNLNVQINAIENGVIEVLDIQGKVLFKENLGNFTGNYLIEMSRYEDGMYIVRLSSENTIQEVRVVKH